MKTVVTVSEHIQLSDPKSKSFDRRNRQHPEVRHPESRLRLPQTVIFRVPWGTGRIQFPKEEVAKTLLGTLANANGPREIGLAYPTARFKLVLGGLHDGHLQKRANGGYASSGHYVSPALGQNNPGCNQQFLSVKKTYWTWFKNPYTIDGIPYNTLVPQQVFGTATADSFVCMANARAAAIFESQNRALPPPSITTSPTHFFFAIRFPLCTNSHKQGNRRHRTSARLRGSCTPSRNCRGSRNSSGAGQEHDVHDDGHGWLEHVGSHGCCRRVGCSQISSRTDDTSKS